MTTTIDQTPFPDMEKSQSEISISKFYVMDYRSNILAKFMLNFRGLTIFNAACLFTPRGNLVLRFERDFCWGMADEDHSKIISLLSEQVEHARGRGELREPWRGENREPSRGEDEDELPF
jgi:hypothetical protein